VLLRKEVKRRTRTLNQEIEKHKHTLAVLEKEKMRTEKSEKELIQLKEDLELQVAERTLALEEKVQKLDKSQKAMRLMVEDLNRITAELNEKRVRLELSNRELEAFTYSVSHDLRAPLRAINGFASFLGEDYADKLDDEGKRFITTIRANASKMDRLITDMLNLSRISQTEIRATDVDMKAMVKSMFHEIASEAEKESFELVIEDLPRAKCDATLMKQVWQNLLSNALKYSSKASVKKIEIYATVFDHGIQYCVKDYGAGFNEKYMDKVFGLFQRLHKESEYKGTGVGLAIVQRIINRHGGRVWAEGKINQGAKFYFLVPF
jgi:light-regulated signal transduction histidine kinase (bacteriophytochrome)